VSDDKPRCRVVGAGESYVGRQGTEFVPGVSAQSVGAKGLCLHLSIIRPGGRAVPHLHAHHETAIYVLSGEVDTWFGDKLDECVTAGPGDFIYIPAGMPHLPVNRSATEPLTVVLARTDPNEQESVVLLAELDDGHIPTDRHA
jgi:uncharacterized RmlC-like cupin family protein